MDTLEGERIRQIMRLADLEKIIAGIEAATAADLTPIKLNSVVVRGLNDDDLVEMARLTIDQPIHVRFIELMPFGVGSQEIARQQVVPSAESRQRLKHSG